MEILKPGYANNFKPDPASRWVGTCQSCGCQFACTGAEVEPHENTGGWVKRMGHHVFYSRCPQANENDCKLSGVTEVFPAEIDGESTLTPLGDESCPSTLPP